MRVNSRSTEIPSTPLRTSSRYATQECPPYDCDT